MLSSSMFMPENERYLQPIPIVDVALSLPRVGRLAKAQSPKLGIPIPPPPQITAAISEYFGPVAKITGAQRLTGGHHGQKGIFDVALQLPDRNPIRVVAKVNKDEATVNEAVAQQVMSQTPLQPILVSLLHKSDTVINGHSALILSEHGEALNNEGKSPLTFRDVKKNGIGSQIPVKDAVRFQIGITRIVKNLLITREMKTDPSRESSYSMQYVEFPEVVAQFNEMVKIFFLGDTACSDEVTHFLHAQLRLISSVSGISDRTYPSIAKMLQKRMEFFREPFYTVSNVDLDMSDKNFVFDELGRPKKVDFEMANVNADPRELAHVMNKHIMNATAAVDQIDVNYSGGSVDISNINVNFSAIASTLEQMTWQEIIPMLSTLFNGIDPQFALGVLKYRFGGYLHEAAYADSQDKVLVSLLLAGETVNLIKDIEEQRLSLSDINPRYLLMIPGIYTESASPSTRRCLRQ